MICGHVMDADRERMFHLLVMLLGLGLGQVRSGPLRRNDLIHACNSFWIHGHIQDDLLVSLLVLLCYVHTPTTTQVELRETE